ncbi:MAG: hypothetical protein LLG01_06915 [Planctomycetaceae bacterium]|nr:hypothetical protein [Planctomycetaceae bacterium]
MNEPLEHSYPRAAAVAAVAAMLAVTCAAFAAPRPTSRPARLGSGRPDHMRTLPVAVPATNEAVDQDMLNEQPAVPLIRGRDEAIPPDVAPRGLPEDGELMENRLCRLRQDSKSGWVMVEFVDDEGRPAGSASWALPCGLLEEMEREAARHDAALFRVSGEFALYDNRSFVMMTKASLRPKLPPRKKAASQPASASAPTRPSVVPASRPAYFAVTQGATSASGPASATQPATASAPVAQPATEPASRPAAVTSAATSRGAIPESLPGVTAEDVMAELRKDAIMRPVVEEPRPTTPQANEESVAPLPAEQTIESLRGAYVVDRLAVVMPAGKQRWLQVRFVSDNNLLEPPLRLLPCHQLRRAELKMASVYKGRTVYLKVSGLLTYYKGQRFLMLRKAVEEPNMDRF